MRTLSIVWLMACSQGTLGPSPTSVSVSTDGVDTDAPPIGPTTEVGWTTDTGAGGLPACSPALAVTGPTSVPAHGLAQLVASGGTGDYLYSLGAGAAGSIHSVFGSYLASGVVGGTDDVVVTDAGCAGEARLAITTTPDLSVLPAAGTLLPGTAFAFAVSGGSGQHTCALTVDGSSASLLGCTYTAGAVAGTDIVEVRDLVTGETAVSALSVDPGTTWSFDGSERWFLPVGSDFVPSVRGGTGVVDLTVRSGGGVTAIPGGLHGDTEGRAEVEVRDRFTGDAAVVDVAVVGARAPVSARMAFRTLTGEIEWAGDLDGDGFDEVVVGFIESSAAAFYGGSVGVYRGTVDGIASTPAQVFAGDWTYDYVGRSLVVRDFDGDGTADLAYGSDALDLGNSDQGAVRVHYGVPGALFEEEPSTLILGTFAADRLGSSLAACDVNGDGLLDLAVGGYAIEDRSPEVYPNDTGGVKVFLNSAAGFSAASSVVRYGVLPDGLGSWMGVAYANFAFLGLGAGDFNGDGFCDLALGAPYVPWDGVTAGDPGVVEIFAGDPVEVLSTTPVATFANLNYLDTNGNFGREVALGDLNGDGRDDLVVGHWTDDLPSAAAGSVKVWFGGDFPADPLVPYDAASPDWRYAAPTSYDYAGVDFDLLDADADGYVDLFVGAPNADRPDLTVYSTGTVVAVRGASIAAVAPPYDASADPPWLVYAGDESGMFYGQAVAAMPDRTGDGLPEVATVAARADGDGADVGQVTWQSGAAGAPVVRASIAGEASGHEHGRSVAFADLDGDGVEELWVGSPGDQHATHGYNAGTVSTFPWDGDRYDPLGVGFALDTPNVDGGERRGQRMVSLDFDGDGALDVAIVSQNDSKPSSFDAAAYANPTECPAATGLGVALGAVRIYRGGPTGMAATPSFVWYGPVERGYLRQVAAGDFNGDGRDDLVVGANGWANAGVTTGGMAVLSGRVYTGGGLTQVVCELGTVLYGTELYANAGESVAGIGDLDGDGCDELAVGSPYEDVNTATFSNRGVVRVVYGWGSRCDPGIRVAAVAPANANAYAGWSVVGGEDVDADGVPDLVVGAPTYRSDLDERGAVWIVSGAHVLSLIPTWATAGAAFPVLTDATVGPMTPASGDANYLVEGVVPLGKFGRQVALVEVDGAPWVAVGAPDGSAGTADQTGGVWLYRWRADSGDGRPGLDPVPAGVLAGEALPYGDLGEVVASGWVDGAGALAVGAPWSSAIGLQTGAVYVLRFD